MAPDPDIDMDELRARHASLGRAWIRVAVASPVLLVVGARHDHSIALAAGIACAVLSVVYHVAWRRLAGRLERLADVATLRAEARGMRLRRMAAYATAGLVCAVSAAWMHFKVPYPDALSHGLAIAFGAVTFWCLGMLVALWRASRATRHSSR